MRDISWSNQLLFVPGESQLEIEFEIVLEFKQLL